MRPAASGRSFSGSGGYGLCFALFLAFTNACFVAMGSAQAPQEATADVYARVVAEAAPLRTGPGHRFRIAHVARRGETFAIHARAAQGYWLEVRLADGSRAFVQGDMVLAEEAASRTRSSRIFAPPPIPSAKGEIAVVLGALSESGLMAVRPNWLLAPVFGLEANLVASVGASGRLFMGGLGGLFNLFPTWPVVPFFVGGGGIAYALPNADSFVLEEGTRAMMYGGGGFRVNFRHRITVRVEARGYTFFDEDALRAQQEISCGLAAFF